MEVNLDLDSNTNIDLTLSENRQINRTQSYITGIKSGIPIALGYIPIAIAFGILARSSNTPNYITMLMSLIVFAGASQFIGVQLIILGSSPMEIIATTFVLNLRHFLMTSSLTQKLDSRLSKPLLALIAFGVTDETFSVASTIKLNSLKPGFLLGLNFIAFSAWNFGTWIGLFAGNILPESLVNSMNIALYCMFIGLLIPSIKNNKSFLIVSVSAMIVHAILRYLPMTSELSVGTTIILSTIIASGLGTLFFKEGGKNE
jgi:4-azaleucine resistance transporter AzlC